MSRHKDRSKNLRRGVQTAPEHERVFDVQRPRVLDDSIQWVVVPNISKQTCL